MLTLTTIQDRRLDEHLAGEPELPRYFMDDNGFIHDRDNSGRYATLKAYKQEQSQIENAGFESQRGWDE